MRAGSTQGRGRSIWANTHNNRKLDDACCGGTGASCDVHVCGFYVRIRFSRFFMLFVRFFSENPSFVVQGCLTRDPTGSLSFATKSREGAPEACPEGSRGPKTQPPFLGTST